LGPPALPGGGPVAVPHFVAANTIDRLFMSPSANAPGGAWTQNQANAMFGFTPRQPWAEVGYKGPYLGSELQSMMDPWGTRYLILGYNEHGQATGGPIWIVSAGPRKTITPANLTPDGGTHEYTSHWTLAGLSEQNLVLRVN
ncbi:MAG: hypothetical protein P4L36_17705, partial [Holophaga sp.]|nr:hypothetical protein [Holophaga sp.]